MSEPRKAARFPYNLMIFRLGYFVLIIRIVGPARALDFNSREHAENVPVPFGRNEHWRDTDFITRFNAPIKLCAFVAKPVSYEPAGLILTSADVVPPKRPNLGQFEPNVRLYGTLFHDLYPAFHMGKSATFNRDAISAVPVPPRNPIPQLTWPRSIIAWLRQWPARAL